MVTHYIRTASGDTYDAPAQQAWTDFLSNDGYRITVQLPDGTVLILRRDSEIAPVINVLGEAVIQPCHVTIRGVNL